jgi:hypothetical protein
MSFDWSASNYKVITFLETFPMIGDKSIQKRTWDDYDCKKSQNICFICFPKELGPFLEQSSLFLGEIRFSPRGIVMSLGRRSLSWPGEQFKSFFPMGNNHVLGKKEFKLPWGTTLKNNSLGKNHVPKKKGFKLP